MRTILLVDDDDDVRDVATDGLTARGYRVIAVRSAKDALAIFSSAATIDILLTDVRMPGMDGITLAQQARALRPGLIIRFVSGYVPSPAALDAVGGKLIPKPFQLVQLCEEVKKALSGGE